MSAPTWDPDFEDFAVRRSGALLRTAVFLTGDHHVAEDLLQTALVRTAARWRQAHDHPEAYVRQVLVNLVRDSSRLRLRRVREIALERPHRDGAEPADAGFLGDDAVVRHWTARSAETEVDTRDELLRALRRLPARQRAAVVLRFWEELSVTETAAAMGCTEGTVKSATSRGLGALRQVLAPPADHADGGRLGAAPERIDDDRVDDDNDGAMARGPR